MWLCQTQKGWAFVVEKHFVCQIQKDLDLIWLAVDLHEETCNVRHIDSWETKIKCYNNFQEANNGRRLKEEDVKPLL